MFTKISQRSRAAAYRATHPVSEATPSIWQRVNKNREKGGGGDKAFSFKTKFDNQNRASKLTQRKCCQIY